MLSILSRAIGAFTRRSSGDAGAANPSGPGGSWIPAWGGSVSGTGMMVSQATAMQVSAVYACVTIRSTDVARCTPSLYSESANGTRTRIKAADHPVARLFTRPNPVQTWFEFAQMMGAALLLRGNAYAVVLRRPDGTPWAMIPINPDQVVMLEAPDGGLFYSVARLGLWQAAMLRDLPMRIAAEDVFHLRGPSLSVLMGISTIGAGREAIGLAQAQEAQAARWIKNGAKPSGVLTTDKSLSDTAFERLRQRWDSWRTGIDSTGSVPILEDGLTYKTVQLNSVELEFLAQRGFQLEEIARMFNVPPRKLGRPDTSRGSTPGQLDQEYVNGTIAPDCDLWEQKLVHFFVLDEEGLGVDLDEERLLRADLITRFTAYRIGILSGVMEPNRARRKEGWGDVPGGDEVFRPLNMAILGSDVTGTAPDGAGTHPAGTIPDTEDTTGAANADPAAKAAEV